MIIMYQQMQRGIGVVVFRWVGYGSRALLFQCFVSTLRRCDAAVALAASAASRQCLFCLPQLCHCVDVDVIAESLLVLRARALGKYFGVSA